MNILTSLQSSGAGQATLTGTINGVLNFFGDGHAALTGTIDTSGASGGTTDPNAIHIDATSQTKAGALTLQSGLTIGNSTDNLNSLIIFRTKGQVADSAAPFSLSIFSSFVAGAGANFYDDVFIMGYNQNPDGSKVIAGEPQFGVGWESHYYQNSKHYTEYNMNFTTYNWNGSNVGQTVRPIYMAIKRDDPAAESFLHLRVGRQATAFRIFNGDSGQSVETQTTLFQIDGDTKLITVAGDINTTVSININSDTGLFRFGANNSASLQYGGSSSWVKVNTNLQVLSQLKVGTFNSQAGLIDFPTGTGFADYQIAYGATTVNGQFDLNLWTGYNITQAGARISNSISAIFTQHESGNYTGSQYNMRFSVNGINTAGTKTVQPFLVSMERASATDVSITSVIGSTGTSAFTVFASDGTTARLKADITGLGFFNTAPVAKPTVSGAKGSNAALGSLMTALAALGLVTDSTSA